MHRKFRSKKKIKKYKFLKFLFIILILFFLYKIFHLNLNFKFDQTLIKYIVNDNNYSSLNNVCRKFIDNNTHDVINNPSNLLINDFYYNKQEVVEAVSNKKDTINKPLVYLYNSHQNEDYSMEYMEDYNINPTVKMVSYMIKERLDNMGIYTLVEENDVSKYLKDHDMKYYQSYEVSRHFLLNVMEKYRSILLYIDIHRDAISHDYSTTTINELDCAKIMFVVGCEHENYLKNLESANVLNNMIKDKYPTLTRGVLEKEGKDVNGIYNQDLGNNIMLIEIGGNYNNINEVLNTVSLITPIIGEYVNEKK